MQCIFGAGNYGGVRVGTYSKAVGFERSNKMEADFSTALAATNELLSDGDSAPEFWAGSGSAAWAGPRSWAPQSMGLGSHKSKCAWPSSYAQAAVAPTSAAYSVYELDRSALYDDLSALSGRVLHASKRESYVVDTLARVVSGLSSIKDLEQQRSNNVRIFEKIQSSEDLLFNVVWGDIAVGRVDLEKVYGSAGDQDVIDENYSLDRVLPDFLRHIVHMRFASKLGFSSVCGASRQRPYSTDYRMDAAISECLEAYIARCETHRKTSFSRIVSLARLLRAALLVGNTDGYASTTAALLPIAKAMTRITNLGDYETLSSALTGACSHLHLAITEDIVACSSMSVVDAANALWDLVEKERAVVAQNIAAHCRRRRSRQGQKRQAAKQNPAQKRRVRLGQ